MDEAAQAFEDEMVRLMAIVDHGLAQREWRRQREAKEATAKPLANVLPLRPRPGRPR